MHIRLGCVRFVRYNFLFYRGMYIIPLRAGFYRIVGREIGFGGWGMQIGWYWWGFGVDR